jgi:hypothetical protein
LGKTHVFHAKELVAAIVADRAHLLQQLLQRGDLRGQIFLNGRGGGRGCGGSLRVSRSVAVLIGMFSREPEAAVLLTPLLLEPLEKSPFMMAEARRSHSALEAVKEELKGRGPG